MGKYKYFGIGLVVLAVIGLAINYLRHYTVAVFSPQGQIAGQERGLMITATLLMLIVVIPVFILTFGIAWRYRAGNKKAKHTPDWDHNRWIEAIWWGIPCVIIGILAVITWNSTHALDPFKAINSKTRPMTIQVVALQWKWLFIYPEQNIATVNFVEIPQQTPIDFEITSDAPMNSFWIPQLGGQIYAMPGMSTDLHLIASHAGSYRGSSANISGSGFASMDFIARSASQSDFNSWVNSVRQSPKHLTLDSYRQLAKPGVSNLTYYGTAEAGLYNAAVMKYMAPGGSS